METTHILPAARPYGWLIWTALATVYVVWGSTYLAIRFALESFPPFLQMGTRFLAAGALLFAFMKWRGAPLPNRREWRNGAIVGILMLGCGGGLTAFGQQTVSSSLTAIFIATVPLAAALWSGLFGAWPSRMEWAGILVGFAGVLLLASGAGLARSPQGVIALSVAVAAWTLGSILSQRRLPLAPGAMGFASEMLAGGVFLVLLGAVRGEAIAWPAQPLAAAAWGYLVVAGSLAAFSAYMYLLSKVTPALATSYAYVNPVIAIFLGVALAGETLSTRELAASGIILGSVLLITLKKRAT